MPIRIEYTPDEIGVILHHEGVVTGEELISAVSAVYKDNRFPGLRFWIADRTLCTRFPTDKSCLRKIADMNKTQSRRNPDMLLALVSPNDYEYGMTRMFLVFSESAFQRTKIFRDRISADKWLEKELASLQ